MSNKFEDIDIINIIDLKKFDPNDIEKDVQKSCKNILIYYNGYATIKDSNYVKSKPYFQQSERILRRN